MLWISPPSFTAVQWTTVEGKSVPWTGWLQLAEGAGPVAAGVYVLALEGGRACNIRLLADAGPDKPAPIGFAGGEERQP